MSQCIVCHQRRAEIPDRHRPGKAIKRLCKACHARRLIEDMQRIVDQLEQEDKASR